MLYMQEDMWLNADVEALFFKEVFQQMKAQQWPLVKLHCASIYQTKASGQKILGHSVTELDNQKKSVSYVPPN